jgi:hypothetical protein
MEDAEVGPVQLPIRIDNWEGGFALSVFHGAEDGLAQLGAIQCTLSVPFSSSSSGSSPGTTTVMPARREKCRWSKV